MNSIIFFDTDLVSESRVDIKGERANALIKRHALVAGLTLSAAILGGFSGKFVVENQGNGHLSGSLNLVEPPYPLLPIDVIVGLSRPQTMKKIILLANSYGVRRLYIVRTAGTDKSYLQSKVLRTDEIFTLAVEGLEQSGGSLLTEIKIVSRFNSLIENDLSQISKNRFIAHAKNHPESISFKAQGNCNDLALAIGSESGWTESEVNKFTSNGFKIFSLGVRQLRTEVATAVALGKLQALLD